MGCSANNIFKYYQDKIFKIPTQSDNVMIIFIQF